MISKEQVLKLISETSVEEFWAQIEAAGVNSRRSGPYAQALRNGRDAFATVMVRKINELYEDGK